MFDPVNAVDETSWIVFGKITWIKFGLLEKQFDRKTVTCVFPKYRVLRLQLWNELESICSSESGKLISLRDVHDWNAYGWIACNVFPSILTFLILSQFENAYDDIVLTPSGMLTISGLFAGRNINIVVNCLSKRIESLKMKLVLRGSQLISLFINER